MIDSVLGRVVDDTGLIIVNDGSIDSTADDKTKVESLKMRLWTKLKIIEHARLIRSLLIRKTFWLILIIDICLILLSLVLAYSVRFEFSILNEFKSIIFLAPLMIGVKIPIFYFFGLYRGMWRYTSISDVHNITKAVSVSFCIIILAVLYTNRFEGFSRSVFFIDSVLTFLFICFHRGTIRFLLQDGFFTKLLSQQNGIEKPKKRILLVGAGAAAEKVIREVRDNKDVLIKIVGLVDDDKNKQGLKIHGIPVLGRVADTEECAQRVKAEELLIAVCSATEIQMRNLISICRKSQLTYKVLPSIGEIIKGNLAVSSIREVDYKDLLGRPVVKLDRIEIGSYLEGQVVLVTGAGGTIGSELCRQIIPFNPKMILLLDSGEENLYNLQMDLEHNINFTDYIPILGNCCNQNLLTKLFVKYEPSVVFHAAAYKHVPLVELNPWEGVFNNIVAFRNLFDIATKNSVKRFVLVSSDKAVRPTNVMGASKRVTELIMHSYYSMLCKKTGEGDKSQNMVCMAVRFGNVLGSSGSVIPLFKNQIERGGPVTVTDPRITRYFMAIEEAAQLILQAGAMGKKGEIFLLKMGRPVNITDLAKDLIVLMGYEPEKDISIVYTGMRPGEKLFEELITEGEGIVQTSHDKIMVLENDKLSDGKFEKQMETLITAAKDHDAKKVKNILNKMVPEYSPDMNSVE